MADIAEIKEDDDKPLPPIKRPVELKPKLKQLHPQRFVFAKHQRNIWDAQPEADVTVEDLKNPGYWAHIAKDLRQGDRIEVLADDGSYFAELLVQDVGAGYAKVFLLRSIDLVSVEPGSENPATSEFEVKWSGRHTKFRVIRKSDGKVLQENLVDKSAGNTWIANHMKAMR